MKICMQPRTYTQQELSTVVDELYRLLQTTSVMTFEGPLGAGKTTLVRELLRFCGVHEPVVSPTFSYVYTYRVGGQVFHHFDLYRLTGLDDFVQAGFDEYLYQPHTKVFIEWPEIIMPLLTREACMVTLDYVNEKTRYVSACCVD